jgi:hypothetical protein
MSNSVIDAIFNEIIDFKRSSIYAKSFYTKKKMQTAINNMLATYTNETGT